MAEGRRYGLSTQLDIEQILLEAQNRWLRPPEICEILRNYQKFRIAPEPPNRPPSGSLFLFDRKVQRYFRKDGHNWRKKKDGKTVKEAHERLKAGSVDVLHCYYAHGEGNEIFQRRSYWMLEEDLMHIVLVHYREVKGNKINYRTRDPDETSQSAHSGSPIRSNFFIDNNQVLSRTMDTSSLNSAHTSELDDAESDNHQASSRYHSFLDLQESEDRPGINSHLGVGLLNSYFPASYPTDQSDYQGKQLNIPGSNFVSLGQENLTTKINDSGLGFSFHESRKQNGAASWEEALEHSATQFQEDYGVKQEVVSSLKGQLQWQIASEDDSSHVAAWPMDQKLHTELVSDQSIGFQEQKGHYVDVDNGPDTFSTNSDRGNESFMPSEFHLNLSNAEVGGLLTSDLDTEKDQVKEEDLSHYSSTRHPLIEDDVFKKFDSFSRWMSKELGEVHEAHVQPSSGSYWSTVESGNAIEVSGMSPQVHDAYLLSPPSLSQDQLFSILDFSPNWAYTGVETKVLITGTFLKDKNDATKCKWSCMFGEVEVLAEVLADGVLRCRAPVHAAGRVPFYITCSNRVACSEVREFEYRIGHSCYMDTDTHVGSTTEMILRVRLGKLLSLDSVGYANTLSNSDGEKSHIGNKISSLLKEDDNEWFQMEKLTTEEEFSLGEVKERLLQRILKDKLHAWLLHKVADNGKGPSVWDKEGQGVLHLAAALGYDWAIAPTIAAGVNINFRDVNGWTALHWAASCGREQTVITLVALGGAPGALTHPTPEFPSGRAPADLASINGHKGIAGYLAESSLKAHLEALTLEPFEDGSASEVRRVKAIQTIAELSATQYIDGDIDGQPLKDSLTAVRNAVQAAARIHEVFRVQSFHRKQLIESGDEKFGMSDERALSFISFKSNRAGQHNEPTHTAAIRIQNKFRSWKGRKEFLIIRQRIVKIQAHVRGYQVRKHYRKIIWSVGILEKVILRWRRKGSGLRGFRPEGLIEGQSRQGTSSKEDDYDFLKEGRKQTEARLEKALARVRSMVQYPDARDQYHRLLNGVSEFQETKVVLEKLLNDSEEVVEGDDMIDFEALLGDDTFMSTAT
ncbi:hypothetical protein MRB53_021954 [Persea americana]|uniref:Uncharacterized protein n=1 Tax=Persea americana TaxID=3435 RepID=A0ACC2L567_PERAE|nr:hypothetical protein MRB53_021954 [Persea americana]